VRPLSQQRRAPPWRHRSRGARRVSPREHCWPPRAVVAEQPSTALALGAGVSEAPQSDYATVRTRDETGRLLEYVELQGHRSRRPDSPDMIVIAVDDDTGCDTGCIGL